MVREISSNISKTITRRFQISTLHFSLLKSFFFVHFFIYPPVSHMSMGSYNTLLFLFLIGSSGLLWLLGLLFHSAIVDVANNLITQGIMSTYTANALEIVMNLFTFCLPVILIVLVIWYVSSAVGEGDRV